MTEQIGGSETSGDAARFERLLAEATADIREEIERTARRGEANLERLARQLAETLVREMVSRAVSQTGGGESVESANGAAAAVTRLLRRGARFS